MEKENNFSLWDMEQQSPDSQALGLGTIAHGRHRQEWLTSVLQRQQSLKHERGMAPL